jgi:hypothetical protein
MTKSFDTWMASNGICSAVSFLSELESSAVTVTFAVSLSCSKALACAIHIRIAPVWEYGGGPTY